jgi:hypothetical protein
MVAFTPTSDCKTVDPFIVGASSQDWCLKQLGGAFYREYVAIAAFTTIQANIEAAVYYIEGYDSILRGEIPGGFPDREKIVRYVAIDHDTVQGTPDRIGLRIGNAYASLDPNLNSGQAQAPIWVNYGYKSMSGPETQLGSVLQAGGLKQDGLYPDWNPYDQNRHLFFEFTITGNTGPAVGSDTAWAGIHFEILVM